MIEVTPECPWQMGLGGIIVLPTAGLLAQAGVGEGSLFVALVGLFACPLGVVGTAVFSMHLRGPYEVRIEPDGRMHDPTWFGTRTATLPLDAFVRIAARRGSLVLVGMPGTRNVGWSRMLFGQPALDAITAAIRFRYESYEDMLAYYLDVDD